MMENNSMEYKNISPFINRQQEIAYIQEWIEEEPNNILFFYGPKSSGKTTLIYRFFEEHLKDEKKYSIKLFNLREVLLVNEDIVYWLNNLDKESNIKDYVLTPDQIEYVWEHFGGSIWEISTLLGDLLSKAGKGKIDDRELEKTTERYMLLARSYFKEYAGLDDSKSALLREIHRHVQDKGFFEELDLRLLLEKAHYSCREALLEELNNLVRNNFLYYNLTMAEYKLQGRSMEIGLARYVREISGQAAGA